MQPDLLYVKKRCTVWRNHPKNSIKPSPWCVCVCGQTHTHTNEKTTVKALLIPAMLLKG